MISHKKSNISKPAKEKKNRPKSNTHTKKIWLWITMPGIFVIIAIVVCIVAFMNKPTKLSDAYNKCTDEFTKLEAEAEETNSKRDDATIYFKSGTSKETLESMASIMRTFGKAKNVEYSTSEEEYEKMYQEYVNENNQEMLATLETIGKEFMIEKFSAVMRVKVRDVDDLDSVKYVVNNNPDFRKNIDNTTEPSYNTMPYIGFGTLELFDDGKTIMMETEGDDYTDKMNCICTALNMPYRIRDAIGQTASMDRTRKDEWDDFSIEWSYSASNKKLHIVIYQK